MDVLCKQLDYELLRKLLSERDQVLQAADNSSMKGIKGLENRLYGLEQLLVNANKIVKDQDVFAQVRLADWIVCFPTHIFRHDISLFCTLNTIYKILHCYLTISEKKSGYFIHLLFLCSCAEGLEIVYVLYF